MLKVDIKQLTIKNQSKEIALLKNINFNLKEGKVYTILGKNGSGKTTLIKSLTKLLDTKTYNLFGKILWDEQSIYQMSDVELLNLRRYKIRYVFQDLTNNFDPLKKLEFYLSQSKLNTSDLNKILSDFLLPDYKIISELYPYEISGGMAQRLSLMLSIISNPKLLILDEPTSALDYINTNLLKFILKDYCEKLNSVIIVTHDMTFAKEVSGEIAVLKDGILSEFMSADSFYKTSFVL